MKGSENSAKGSERRAALLALAFGTSSGMWLLCYASRLASGLLPNAVLLALLLVCLLAGGILAGRWAAWGAAGGAAVGALASTLNLLILGSVLSQGSGNALRASAALWVPGTIVLGALLAAIGAALGRRRQDPAARVPAWSAGFASVAAASTLMLLAAGGLVTSREAGLAVPDWPNSEGFNMFLLPLGRMSGGVFYEHAHRLMGSLVGLTVLVLALHMQFAERRRPVKILAWLILAAVIVQGILGGLRVTGRFTFSKEAADLAPSTALAIVHGILGQAIFAGLCAMAAAQTRRWRSNLIRESRSSADSDALLSALLVVFLLVQIVLGALLRHLAWGMMAHVAFASLVLVAAIAAGARAWGLYPGQPELKRLGRLLVVLVGVQILLGTGALIAVNLTPEPGNIPAWEVILATSHQVTGALLLGVAVLLACWVRRLLAKPSA